MGACRSPHLALCLAAGKVEPQGAGLYVLVWVVGFNRADHAKVRACFMEDGLHGGLFLGRVPLSQGSLEVSKILGGAEEIQAGGVRARFPVWAEDWGPLGGRARA